MWYCLVVGTLVKEKRSFFHFSDSTIILSFYCLRFCRIAQSSGVRFSLVIQWTVGFQGLSLIIDKAYCWTWYCMFFRTSCTYSVEWLVFPASISSWECFVWRWFRFTCSRSTNVYQYRLSRLVTQTDCVRTLLEGLDALCCCGLFSRPLWVRSSYVVGSPQDCAIN